MKEIISQKKWVYTLYKTEAGLVLSVICGGAGMFNVDVPLTILDTKELEENPDFLVNYAEKIRNNPKEYLPKKN